MQGQDSATLSNVVSFRPGCGEHARELGWYGVRNAANFDKPSSVDRLAAAVASAAFMLERS